MSGRKAFILTILLMFGVSSLTISAQETVVLVYRTANETTKHVFEHLKKGMRQAGLNFKLSALPVDKNFSGTAAGVILLNIASTGVEPAIKDFLNRNKTLPRPILLTLKPGTRDFTFKYQEAAKVPEGIDTLTAATGWSDWDNANQTMHNAWVKKAFELISTK